MIDELKQFPLVLWLKWVVRKYKIQKRYPTLKVGGYAEITSDCSFGHRNIIYPHAVVSNVKLGDYSYIGGYSHIQNAMIGKYCSIAPEVRIGLGIHPTNLKSTHPAFFSKQSHWIDEIQPTISDEIVEYKHIYIGDDVWIGARSLILDGVKIGSHAVIAAGAVVTKDVPEYAIVGGVPAKIIKYREII